MAAPAYGYPASGPPLRDPTAVMGRRIGAFFIDAIVAIVVFGSLFAATSERLTVSQAKVKYGCEETRNDFDDNTTSLHCPNRQVVTLGDTVYVTKTGTTWGLDVLASFLYFALLPGVTGWTLGKLLVGVRVVDANGNRAGIGRNAIRWIVFVVDAFFFFLPGLIAALSSKGHRRIGDMAAGTFVVDHRAVGTPPLATAAYPPQGYAPPPYGQAPPPSSGQARGSSQPPPAPTWGTPPPPPPSMPAQPQWDAARNTYVQHDAATGGWLQWDAASGTWKALDS